MTPERRFQLDGTIYDHDFSMGNVTVTVISGVGQGLTTRSAANGSFTLGGVAGPIQIRLQKEGYPDQIEQVDVTAHRRQTFFLGVGVPRTDYSGTYALTISAAASCLATLPEAARRRVYTANVKPHSSNDPGFVTVTLADADFVVTGDRDGSPDRFFGLVDPTGGITFSIGTSDIFYEFHIYDLEERFGNDVLIIRGIVTATSAPTRISGTLNGSIGVATEARTFPRTYLSECRAGEHGFEMVRR